MNKQAELTMLSYGAGQDSYALLLKYIHDPLFRATYCPGRFIVVMADTGDEHPATYAHITYTKKLCKKHGIEFYFITSDMGFHPRTWQSLRGQLKANNTILSKTFIRNGSCTDNLKIKPIYNFLGDYIIKKYRLDRDGAKMIRKKEYYRFARIYGKINVLLGISRGEESRVSAEFSVKWMKKTLTKSYPLISMGMNREDCQNYIRSVNEVVPPPSNCVLCPWMNKKELLWLWRFLPESFKDWCTMEEAKLENDLKVHGKKKNGVWGEKTLDIILEEAKAEFGHLSDEQLNKHKFEGHCTKSKH